MTPRGRATEGAEGAMAAAAAPRCLVKSEKSCVSPRRHSTRTPLHYAARQDSVGLSHCVTPVTQL